MENIANKRQKEFFRVNEIVKKYSFDSRNLIAILQDIQKEYRYLPEEILTYMGTILDIPLSRIYGVATFYSQFSLTPKGKYEVKVCDGTACHVRGSSGILNVLYRKLGLGPDKVTTDDLLFSLETVSCLGACGLAPVVVINDKVYPQMTPEKIEHVIDELKNAE